ncbi:DinB family protein [Psychrobacillus vulpis]|uniref:DinB family protein n=1 Tax=Psychrobacillus vulpis TaxID=2325572 RepID=A0A544TTE0_9BACI|nr:DinB family protein [Psychrobacillus vulpis]TQR20721.1 DinB family protein [Psychrobacillus vulpis]
MNATNLLILNFNEIRRRSIKIWNSIPEELYSWKPDENALTCLEMVRHVLESEYYYHLAVNNRGSISNFVSPFESRELLSVQDELHFAQQFRNSFMSTIQSFNEEDLKNIRIDRSDVGYVRDLGDMLLRIAYHEAVHTGQILDYLRTAGVDRPNIWD